MEVMGKKISNLDFNLKRLQSNPNPETQNMRAKLLSKKKSRRTDKPLSKST